MALDLVIYLLICLIVAVVVKQLARFAIDDDGQVVEIPVHPEQR